jgi:peptide/nickel transport system substrate-binding protein
MLPLKNWWIQMALPNVSNPPTDSILVRKAIQAALDMDEIMTAASDGRYQLNAGFQYPHQSDYTDAGKETYNQHNSDLAKKYLADAGYQGEPVVLLTNMDYPAMYNAALVVQQELQAIGINAEMKVVDWPTSVQMASHTTQGWNLMFTAWGTQPALGALATMQFLVRPNASYKPVDGQDDPDVLAAWQDMNRMPTVQGRQEAFARMQQLVLERVYALPFGSLTKVQAVRSNVAGFEPFRIPRMANVWFSH